MPTLRLRFPGGRYHATPWGHHVNEGLIEWPPSPWRLLRALIACGFSSQGWGEVPPVGRSLIEKLASVLPGYWLPVASAAHTRHYMPIIEGSKQKTTLVFDTWANISADDAVTVHWPCELTEGEATLLGQLASALGYLGRSESWVEAELLVESGFGSDDCNAFAHREGVRPQRGFEQVSLMAAVPQDAYGEWRRGQVEAALAELPLPDGKKKPSKVLLDKREKVVAPYPSDLLSCLTKDTVWWKGHGWSQPPGSQRVLYWRRSDALQVGVPQRARPPRYPIVTTMILSVTTPSGNSSALPSITRTLPQAELFHRAIVGRAGEGQRIVCPELTGRDEEGRPLQSHHAHAHTVPLDLDGDGRIDHIVIYAPMGLRGVAQQAIRRLRRTWTKGGVGDLQVAVIGAGGLEILRQLPLERASALLGPMEGSCIWESVTPFVFPRFLKVRGKNTMLGQVNVELATRGLSQAVSVEVLPELSKSMRHFVRQRQRGGSSAPMDSGYGLRLVFTEPVRGPLMLGYAAHYGLGLFRSVQDISRDA